MLNLPYPYMKSFVRIGKKKELMNSRSSKLKSHVRKIPEIDYLKKTRKQEGKIIGTLSNRIQLLSNRMKNYLHRIYNMMAHGSNTNFRNISAYIKARSKVPQVGNLEKKIVNKAIKLKKDKPDFAYTLLNKIYTNFEHSNMNVLHGVRAHTENGVQIRNNQMPIEQAIEKIGSTDTNVIVDGQDIEKRNISEPIPNCTLNTQNIDNFKSEIALGGDSANVSIFKKTKKNKPDLVDLILNKIYASSIHPDMNTLHSVTAHTENGIKIRNNQMPFEQTIEKIDLIYRNRSNSATVVDQNDDMWNTSEPIPKCILDTRDTKCFKSEIALNEDNADISVLQKTKKAKSDLTDVLLNKVYKNFIHTNMNILHGVSPHAENGAKLRNDQMPFEQTIERTNMFEAKNNNSVIDQVQNNEIRNISELISRCILDTQYTENSKPKMALEGDDANVSMLLKAKNFRSDLADVLLNKIFGKFIHINVNVLHNVRAHTESGAKISNNQVHIEKSIEKVDDMNQYQLASVVPFQLHRPSKEAMAPIHQIVIKDVPKIISNDKLVPDRNEMKVDAIENHQPEKMNDVEQLAINQYNYEAKKSIQEYENSNQFVSSENKDNFGSSYIIRKDEKYKTKKPIHQIERGNPIRKIDKMDSCDTHSKNKADDRRHWKTEKSSQAFMKKNKSDRGKKFKANYRNNQKLGEFMKGYFRLKVKRSEEVFPTKNTSSEYINDKKMLWLSFFFISMSVVSPAPNPQLLQLNTQQLASNISYSYALDFSQVATPSQMACIKSAGNSAVFISAYDPSGNGRFDSNASINVNNAYAAGLGVETYMIPQPYSTKSGQSQVDDIKTGYKAHGIYIKFLWIQITDPRAWPGDIDGNIKFINNLILQANQFGWSVGIYTSFTEWDQITNNYAGLNKNVLLWYWNTFGTTKAGETNPDFGDFRPFGNWKNEPSVKQYGQQESICKMYLNKDVYATGTKMFAQVDAEGSKLIVGNTF